jgi:hypothetical protein
MREDFHRYPGRFREIITADSPSTLKHDTAGTHWMQEAPAKGRHSLGFMRCIMLRLAD